MPSHHADRNLLLGIVALQLNFIGRDQLVAAMHAWVLRKDEPLELLLLEQGAIDETTRLVLVAAVQRHLDLHEGDPGKSLAAVSAPRPVREDLRRMEDNDVQTSLLQLAPRDVDPDPFATQEISLRSSVAGGSRFQVLRPHAKGGLGEVFVAEDTELKREVALKEILPEYGDHPEARLRFVREAEITGGLEHPGIVPVYGLGLYPDGRPYYAMRFIRGESLHEAIKRFHRGEGGGKGRVSDFRFRSAPFRQLLRRFIDVCNTIEYAHSRQILHRDLKPSNIMLGKYAETLVVDWGLAKPLASSESVGATDETPLYRDSTGDSAPTRRGSQLGTPGFMSPEQATGKLDQLGPPADVYSLGATLYCILTGKAPLPPRDDQYRENIAAGYFPKPREVQPRLPAPLEAICLKAMAPQLAERYSSAAKLAEEIERWLADEPVKAWPDPPTVRLRRWVSRHRTLVSTSLATILVAAVGAFAGTKIYYDAELRVQRTEKERLAAETQAAELELAKQNELETKRKNVAAFRSQGETHLAEEQWQLAKEQLQQALSAMDPDPEAAFASERTHVQRQLARVDERVAAQRAVQQDGQRYARLDQLWQDAVFYSPWGPYEFLLGGQSTAAGFARAQEAARSALVLFSLDPQSDRWIPLDDTLQNASYTESQKETIQDRCYEAMLIWAETVARAAPTTDDPTAGWEQAVRILERAEPIFKHSPRALQRQRNEYRRQLAAALGNASPTTEPADLSADAPQTALEFFLQGKQALNGSEGQSVGPAIRALEQALRREPSHFWSHFLLALSYLNDASAEPARRAQLAKVHLAACASQKESFPGQLLLRGMISSQLPGETPQADADFAALLEDSQADPALQYVALLQRALLRRSEGRLSECLRDLNRAIQIRPEDFQAYKNLAYVYVDQRNPVEAARWFAEAARLAPARPELHRELTWILLQLKQREAALETLQKAIAIRAEEADYIVQGAILQSLGRTAEAKTAFESAANGKPSTEADMLRARLLKELDQGDEPLDSWVSFFYSQTEDQEPSRHYGLALLAARRGDHVRAIDELGRALEAAPNASFARQMRGARGWLYLVNDAPQLALSDFDAVLAGDERNANALLGRGQARAKLKVAGATEDAERALQLLEQKTDRAYFNAARVYALMADAQWGMPRVRSIQRAVELLDAALATTPVGRARFYQERILSDRDLRAIRNSPQFQSLAKQ